MKEGTGEGCVNIDLDGDGQITEGKTVYLWYGEDKTNNTRPVDGVKCYVSTDLYNWTDKGTVLYLQSSICRLKNPQRKQSLPPQEQMEQERPRVILQCSSVIPISRL